LILFALGKKVTMAVPVLVIDDDELSREVFSFLLQDAGYEVQTADSGDEALLRLQSTSARPKVVLTDLQMPGTSGKELALQLRALCGPSTTLLAMSASEPEDDSAREFDGFLLKPFTMATLAAAIAGKTSEAVEGSSVTDTSVLDETVYRKLSQSMKPLQLEQLYTLCLSDAEGRITNMRLSASNGDDAAYRREAHAVKGGCGMVGALELQMLATAMEQRGLSDDHVATLDEFMAASERLRRILVAHGISHNRDGGVSGEDA
jgi:CheY-like chemotaxis protein